MAEVTDTDTDIVDPVSFQIVDIVGDDLQEDYDTPEFVLTLYGIERNGDRVVCHVKGFKPYFYVKIPNTWDSHLAKSLVREIRTRYHEKLGTKKKQRDPFQKEYLRFRLRKYKDFYGFYRNPEEKDGIKRFKFLRISCSNHGDMKKIVSAIKDYHGYYSSHPKEINVSFKDWFCDKANPTTSNCDSNLYEATLPPVIRFIHQTKIDPTGWVTVKPLPDDSPLYLDTKLFEGCAGGKGCKEYTCLTKDIVKCDETQTSPYVIASFDIECDSAHGDFPQTFKSLKKLAVDIFDSFRLMYTKLPPMLTGPYKDNASDCIKFLLKQGFSMDNDEVSFLKESVWKHAEVHMVYTQGDRKPTLETISSVAHSLHSIDFHLTLEKLPNKVRDETINEINRWLHDILRDEEDEPLKVKGDPVIQIGTVFHTYGLPADHPDQNYRHIVVIGPEDDMADEDICDNLENIDVVCCKNETELLLEWSKIMQQKDPDFITGYNIFGFDFRYLKERVDALDDLACPNYKGGRQKGKSMCNQWGHHNRCPKKEFYNMGKIDASGTDWNHKSKKCQYRKQDLNSSALGENSLSYITMDGRILVDIQKEVQKGHNLESYKLDNVASHFMRGKIKAIDEMTLTTDSIGNLKANDFISFRTHSNIGEQLHESGRKYKIHEIPDSKTLRLTEHLTLNPAEYHKIEWCLNKDDISPQDIFDSHKLRGAEGATKRSLVAKYCIQDCELCINLLLLLDLIPNNLAMANVSYVPASYIFLRGQGIKVTSVVTRVCDQEDTRVPDLKKPPLMRDYVKMLKAEKDISSEEIRGQNITRRREKINEIKDKDDYEDNQDKYGDKIATLEKDIKWCRTEDKDKAGRRRVEDQMIEDAGWRTPKPWELDEWFQEATDIHHGDKGMMGYEGAVVLDPKPGIYLDDPIAVLDYASLYPSSIIEKNLSHETQIEDMDLLASLDKEDYHTLKYVNWVFKLKGKGNSVDKVPDEKEPTKICYFLKPEYMERTLRAKGGLTEDQIKEQGKGIIPKVLDHLLQARSATKKRMKSETDDFKYKVLDGLQLAYKVTANSVYGQLGARTSTIFKMNLAACTTAIGRERIEDAGTYVKEWAEGEGLKEPDVVYGDTDSVFVKFSRNNGDTLLEGREALNWCIECGQKAGAYSTQQIHIKQQHTKQVLEYEKTFWPFILISKKRYTGDKYEFDPHTCKRDAMGIVLKRRDNAPIVKHVFGNVIEIIMMDKDFTKAVKWLTDTLLRIRNGEYDLSYFVITKALRGYYKNPQQIAHKVLADRMAERDPGNKPKSNDRIPYAYIKLPDEILYDMSNPYKSGVRKGKARERNVMQGDRIEHVDYIKAHTCEIDYEFYITNQIMNPVKQVLDLELNAETTELLFQRPA